MHNTLPNKVEVHPLDFLILLLKHSRMIILISVAVTVFAFLILVILPNKYIATARLLAPQQNLTLSGQLLDILGGSVSPGSGGAGMGGGVGGMAASLLGLRSTGELYVSVMNSNDVMDRIIDRFNLKKVYGTKFIDDARKELGKNAKMVAGKKDGIIVIDVTADSPKLAADLANAFIEELERLLQRLANQEANGRLAFLEKERSQSSQNLTKAEEAVRRFSEQNSVLQIDIQTKGALEYIARLRAEIDSKEVSVQVLRQQATPYNYDVVRMETEIKGLKEKLRTVECQYDNNLSDICLPTKKTPALALDYIRLYREAKFQENLYQLYVKLVEIARIDMARDIAVIQVVDKAKPPEKRSNRRLLPSLLIGMITFFMATLGVIMKEYMRTAAGRQANIQRLSVLEEYLTPWKARLNKIKKVFHFKNKS